MRRFLPFVSLLCLGLAWTSCQTDRTPLDQLVVVSPNGCSAQQVWLTDLPYNPVPFVVTVPIGLPPLPVPADNPLTVDGVALGRYLFYDKQLSVNNSQSCAGCHQIRKAFSDNTVLPPGALPGLTATRNSMSLINVAYAFNPNRGNNFMWDGKFATLEQQHIGPVENPVEMASDWRDVECYLRNDTMYQRRFRAAFGIEHSLEITRDLAAKAMAQFVRTLVSANAKFDLVKGPGAVFGNEFTESEERGFTMFYNATNQFGVNDPNFPDAECGHCHNTLLFANHSFTNNGLDSFPTLDDYIDKGLGGVTGFRTDNGKFRNVTLRNIELSAPYMHDGRFNTLEEVMNHYVNDVKNVDNLATDLATPTRPGQGVSSLSPSQIQDVINFLKTLTDTSYFHREEWSDPWD